jgi:hypothetical protein
VTEIRLLPRRTALPQRIVPSPVPPQAARLPEQPDFSFRNSPADLFCRLLWQLVGGYVFVVLLVKDRRLPR